MDIGVDSWLNLGIPGASMLIVLIALVTSMKVYSESLNRLCNKIDALINSYNENNKLLNEVLITNGKDNEHIYESVADMHNILVSMHNKVIKMEAQLQAHFKDGG